MNGHRLATAAVVLGLLGSLTTSAWADPDPHHDHRAAPAHRPTRVASAPGATTALSGYTIQSTAKVSAPASDVSSSGYPATGWYSAGPRSTVLAALLANGVYADPFYSTNQQKIPRADFEVPWWYRSDFTVADTSERTYLDFSGVISAADVYVNGKQVATTTDVTGAYTDHELDVTSSSAPAPTPSPSGSSRTIRTRTSPWAGSTGSSRRPTRTWASSATSSSAAAARSPCATHMS